MTMKNIVTAAVALTLGFAWTIAPASAADDTAKDKLERAGDKAEDKLDRAGDKTERAADKAGTKVERAKDKAGNAVDKTKAKAADVKDTVKNKLSGRDGSDDIRQAQQALQDKGFNPGPIDGKMGPRTRAALSEFQTKENLKVTGRLDSQTKDKLVATLSPAASPSATTGPSVPPTDANAPSSMPAGAATAPGTGADATQRKQTR